MRGFRAGTFEREHMPRALRRFSPASSLERVEDVDLVAPGLDRSRKVDGLQFLHP